MTEKQTEHLLSGPAQQYSFYLYSRLIRAVQEHAKNIERSTSWVVRQALLEYLQRPVEEKVEKP